MSATRASRSLRALLGAAVTAGVLAWPVAAAAATTPILAVNDTNAVGAIGDSLLSLDEAVRLGNGTLRISQLSAAERARVTGKPGLASRDLIRLPADATITLPAQATLSALVGNTGDTLDGAGAALLPAAPGAATGLTISSSDFTLRNFQARDFVVDVRVEFGGRSLRNINLQRVQLFNSGLSELQIGASESNGSLTGVTVTDSVFEGAAEGGQVNVLIFAAQRVTPGAVSNVALNNVLFARNEVRLGGQGLTVGGGFSFTTAMSNAVMRNVRILNNSMTGQKDAPLNVDGAIAALGSTADNVGVDNVLVANNTVESANYGIWTGNEAIGLNAAASRVTANYVRNVVIRNNTVTPGHDGRHWCLTAENAGDFTGDVATNNQITNVQFIANNLSGCVNNSSDPRDSGDPGYGVSIIPGRASVFTDPAPGPGTVTGNRITNVTISRNIITTSTLGVAIRGGWASHPSVSNGNVVSNVDVSGNRISSTTTGVRIVGGDGALGSSITANTVTAVSLAGNVIKGAKVTCQVLQNDGPGASGNIANAACPV